MRILHTSDWHLGRSFGDHRLLDQQALFVDWLVDVVRHEEIDLVTIAGDLYDRSVPPADAVELFHDSLRRMVDAGADVAAITGNHDSAERVGSIDGLLAAGLVIRGGYRRASDVEVRNYSDGPLAIVAVPYLDPAFAPVPSASDDNTAPDNTAPDNTAPDNTAPAAPTHETVLRKALHTSRSQIASGVRSIAIAHAFVTGAEPSDSERILAVGDAGMVSSSVFSDFDYAALGHLHRAQTVAGDETVRYSGAPLPYSFAETSQKEVVIVELDADGDARPKPLPIDVGRTVCTRRGTLAELLAAKGNDRDWIRVELTDPHPVEDAHRRLRDHFPHMVEITRVNRAETQTQQLTTAAVRQRTRTALAGDFLETVTGDVNTDDLRLVQRAIAEVERSQP